MLKRMVADFAHRNGYSIIPNWQIPTHAQTRYMRRLVDLLNIDLVIDVGANAGQFAAMIRDEVGFGGTIFSFEPVPELASGLAIKAHDMSP